MTPSARTNRGSRAALRGGTIREIKDMCTILDGQGRVRSRGAAAHPAGSPLDDGGYLLVALLVGIAVASIWMAAALPAWKQQATREKEAELIFRGEQYARAILLYQQKMGWLPASFDDLISQHTLRHKWKDPITGDDFLPKVGCGQANIVGPGSPGGGINQPPNL